jgi:hypothetical protein
VQKRTNEKENLPARRQAGEFVREEMDHIRKGKHGARSTRQAIAIGLSKARRAGVDLKPPKKGRASEKTRKSAEHDYRKGHSAKKKSPSSKRSSARLKALKREPRSAASHSALSRQAKSAAKRRKRSGPATSSARRTHRKAA